VATQDRLARRATRSRMVVPWQGWSWRDLRHGKAEVSAGSATGGRRITMQGNDVRSDDVWRWRPDAVSSEEPRCNQTRQSCRMLRGCAGRVSVAHVREQKRFSP
jgi:hypothetical protein